MGTHSAPFDRLVEAADAYAGTVDEEVVIQLGPSRLIPNAATSFAFCSSSELEDLIRGSRVVVCHAADTVLDAFRLGRPVVVVPREKRFGEAINDHQVDFARALADQGWVQIASDPSELAAAIETAARSTPPLVPAEPRLALAIRDQLGQWFGTITP